MFYDRITDFIFRSDRPKKADFIFVPGSGYGELAVRAAQLYHEQLAEKVIVSGKYSILQSHFQGAISPAKYQTMYFETESDFLKKVLLDCNVKEHDIIQEKLATFTYENAIYIRLLLERMGYVRMPERILLVCQAFHGARAGMYFQSVFPDTEICVCPAVTQKICRDNWYLNENGVHTVLGEVDRIGMQFPDMLLGRDTTEEKCKNAATNSDSTL